MTTKDSETKTDAGELPESIGDCRVCGNPITGVRPDEVRLVARKPVHDDCYFDEVDDLAEKYLPGLSVKRPGYTQD